jgi:hypothetical protein
MPALSLALPCHHPIDERSQIRRHRGFIELDRVLLRITFQRAVYIETGQRRDAPLAVPGEAQTNAIAQ